MNLYHYCSNAAFVSIVSTREIWASEFSLSNDLLEGKWIRETFKEFCREKGVRDLEQSKLLEDMATVAGIIGGVGFCMSEEADLLSQWRAYADDGAGVSIGFSKEFVRLVSEGALWIPGLLSVESEEDKKERVEKLRKIKPTLFLLFFSRFLLHEKPSFR